jgi:hypothetical protein
LDTLNVCYPFRDTRSPLDWIRQVPRPCPSNLELTAHEPGKYATFSFRRSSPMDLARFIDGVFADLLGSNAEYPLTVKFFRLPE